MASIKRSLIDVGLAESFSFNNVIILKINVNVKSLYFTLNMLKKTE